MNTLFYEFDKRKLDLNEVAGSKEGDDGGINIRPQLCNY